jgi:hypothetical protein
MGCCNFSTDTPAGHFAHQGKRIRLDEKSYYPDYMGGTGLDEIWMCCTVPIVTGVVDTRTGKAPFREGEAHVLTPNGQVISLQDLIVANPKAVMGEKIMAVSESLFGEITWPIVSKKFDNLNPIPHHLHWSKWEVYDINSSITQELIRRITTPPPWGSIPLSRRMIFWSA